MISFYFISNSKTSPHVILLVSELRIEIKKNGLVPRVPRVPRVSRVRVTQTLSVSDEHTLNILCKLAGNVVAVVDYFMRRGFI